MNLSGPLGRITHPNYELIEWAESIENEDSRVKIYNQIGVQLKRQGVPNKKITQAYLQLADRPFVKLQQLTDAQILSYRCDGSGQTAPVSEDEEEGLISETASNDSRFETDNEYFQDDDTSDTVKENEPTEINNSNKTPLEVIPLENDDTKKKSKEGEVLKENSTKDGDVIQELGSIDSNRRIQENEQIQGLKENSIPELKENNVAHVQKETTVVKEVQDNSVDCHLNNLPVRDNELIRTSFQEKTNILDKSQDNIYFKLGVHSGNCTIPCNASKESNIEETVSVTDESRIESNDIRKDTRCKESSTIQSSDYSVLTDNKVKKTNVKERKSAIENSKDDDSLQNKTDEKLINVSSKTINDGHTKDQKTNANKINNKTDKHHPVQQVHVQSLVENELSVQKVNNEIDTSSINRKAKDQSNVESTQDKRLEIESNSTNILKETLLNKLEKRKENNKEEESSHVIKECRTLNTNIKPTISSEERIQMKSLQAQIAKSLSKKNIHLTVKPAQMSPVLTSENFTAQSSIKTSGKTSQKPLISVRTNLFDHAPEKKIDHPGVNITKEKEAQKNKEEKINPAPYSGDSNDLRDSFARQIKEFKSGLKSVKEMAESRKRLSQDSEERIKTVKKRRFSEQSNRSKGSETLKKQEKQVEDHNKMPAQKKSDPQDITIQSLLGSVEYRQPQLGNKTETNVGNPPQVTSPESNRISMAPAIKMQQQRNNPPKSLNQTINNLHIKRQSLDCVRVLQLPTQHHVSVGTTNSVGSSSISENSTKNANNAVLLDKSKTGPSHTSENRSNTENLVNQILVNNQYMPNRQTNVSATEHTQTAPVAVNQPTEGKSSPEINRFIEKAIHLYLMYFCNYSDENIESLPAQVRYSLGQYCNYSGRQAFTTVTEFLKLYMICYIKIFNNEEQNKKICKIAELLHLSLADYHRQKERSQQAVKLQSELLRKEEIIRANKDYEDLLVLRGKQFAEMFLSVLPSVSKVIGCEYLMILTYYFKITQALTKIDCENDNYVFSLRDLIKQLLKYGKQAKVDCGPLFEIRMEEFKLNCLFVKKCLLTLYMSGYRETQTDNFWKLVNLRPVIPNIRQVINEPHLQQNSRTQTVGPSNVSATQGSNTTVAGQKAITLESLLRVEPRQQTDYHVPMNVSFQAIAGMRPVRPQFVNQINTIVNVQNIVGHQQNQSVPQPQVSQRSSAMARLPSQLPPFASLNHPQVLAQHLAQRNLAAPPNTQASMSSYYRVNRGALSVPSQPQLNRKNMSNTPAQYHRAPPPYPGTTTQVRVSPENNQLWQPGGSAGNNLSSFGNRIPPTSHHGMAETTVQDATVSTEGMTHSMTQMCTSSGCSNPATLVCSLCREAVYCTTECQAQDWYGNHSKICLQTSP